MADIFTNDTAKLQAYKLGKTLINIPNGDNLVCAQAQFTYQRQISPVTPLNATKKYLIVGEGTGTGSLALILGPSKSVSKFLKKYSDPCASDNKLELIADSDCKDTEKTKFILSGVIISTIQSTVARGQGSDMMTATVQFSFGSLEVA